jgi:hypothetical protein
MGPQPREARKGYSLRGILACGVSLAILGWAPAAHSQDLRNFISDLYGGNGITLANAAGHAPHFTAESLEILNTLNASISSSVGFSSFNSPVVGLTFDVAQGLPVRTVDSLGALIGERAETLGAQRLNIGVSFTQIKYKRFDGDSLGSLSADLHHIDLPGCNPVDCPWINDFIEVDLNVRVTQNVYAFYATYGVTSRWDIGFILPVVDMSARATADATIIYQSSDTSTHTFTGAPDSPHSESGGTASGIGDLVLRTKYNFLRNAMFPDTSVVAQVRVPTGDEANLLGSGSTNYMGMLVFSKQLGRIAPHVNLGYEVASGGYDRDNLRYAVGADLRVTPNVTIAADLFGRDEQDGFNYTDAAFGAKWAVFDRGLVSGNIIVPVNRDTGLRPDFIWTVAFELTF